MLSVSVNAAWAWTARPRSIWTRTPWLRPKW